MGDSRFQQHHTDRPSDKDPGYTWGMAGKKKAKKAARKSGNLWEGRKRGDK